ncbi:hypothetical protein HDU83_009525 [Entophlyctis luteolus]|nr:hypothetical protein HDU83_009525 [Entophlyctis luteolus]
MGSCTSAEAAAAAATSRKIDKQLKIEQKALEQNIKLLLLGAGETGKSTVLKQIRLIHGTGYSDEERASYRVVILTNVITCAKTLVHAMEFLKIPYAFDPTNFAPTSVPNPVAVDEVDEKDDDDDEDEDDNNSDTTGSQNVGSGSEPKKETGEGHNYKNTEDPIAVAAALAYAAAENSGDSVAMTTAASAAFDASVIVRSAPMGFGSGEVIPTHIANAIGVLWRDTGIQYCFKRANEYQLIDCCGMYANASGAHVLTLFTQIFE